MRWKKECRLLSFILAMAIVLGLGWSDRSVLAKAQETNIVDGDFTIVIPFNTEAADVTAVIDLTPTESSEDSTQTPVTTELVITTETPAVTTQIPIVTTQTPVVTTEQVKLDKARGLTVTELKDKKITLSWSAQYNTANGFQIYRCGPKDVQFKEIGTVTGIPANGTITYTDKTFVKGVAFTYKVVPYHVMSDGQTRLGTESNNISVKRPIETTTFKKCVRKGKKITLKWKKVSGVTGYEIWRVTDSGKKCVKKVKTNNNSCVLKKVNTKTDVQYTVRPYVRYDGYSYTGDYSEEVTIYTSSNKKIADKFKQLQKKYPSYSYWNHMGKNIYNSATITQTPCNHTLYNTKYCNVYYCPNGNIGLQCYGFAWKMSDLIFGENAKIKNHKSFEKAKMGDVIRYNGHSVIILEKHKNYILAGECNIGGTCMIYWGRKIMKSELKNATYSHRY